LSRDPFEQRVQGSAPPPELSPLSALLPKLDGGAPAVAPKPTPPAVTAIREALARLEETIDIENGGLGGGAGADFTDLNRRKSQSLLELTRLSRILPPGGPPALRENVARLRDKLIHNHRTLSLHLAAVKDIAELMVGALSAAESDGTYGTVPPRRDARR
jgi:hypothetical protein